MTFITDVASFFQAFADFLPNQVEQYCEGCNQNYDYCMGNLDAAQDDQVADQAQQQDQQQENEPEEAQDEGEPEGQDEGEQGQEGEQGEVEGEGARKLTKVVELPFRHLQEGAQVVQMIDCNMCTAYDCFAQDEDQAQPAGDDEAAQTYQFEEALDWLGAISKCQQMDSTYNDLPIYAGLLCNAEGTGVEIGVFIDQDCRAYAPKLSFGKMMSTAESQYYVMSEEVVEYMFTNDFSCYQPEIQYTNPYQYVANENEDANQDGNGEAPEASEWCRALYDGGTLPFASFSLCIRCFMLTLRCLY